MSNLLKAHWFGVRTNHIAIRRQAGGLLLHNDSDVTQKAFCLRVARSRSKYIHVDFHGQVQAGAGCTLVLFNRFRRALMRIPLNSESVSLQPIRSFYMAAIEIKPHTEVQLTTLEIRHSAENINLAARFPGTGKTLVITPSYPAPDNIYFSGFIHSRIKAYLRSGIVPDIACIWDYNCSSFYEFEGVRVFRSNFTQLREFLLYKNYDVILLHFFDENYGSVLKSLPLQHSRLYFWIHGPETLYWDTPYFMTPYFQQRMALTAAQTEFLHRKDECLKEFNQWPNLHWVFVSQWIKARSEELTRIKFDNATVIPNIVDEQQFVYQKKSPELRKNIFLLRRYDNVNKYAVDIAVRAILELSRRDFFNELEFSVVGEGDAYDLLLNPLRKFANVKFYKNFFTHAEIARLHTRHGIALFPTRYDAQGVSACEAGMSGLVVLSSDLDSIQEFLPAANLVPVEDFTALADKVEMLYRDPELFEKMSAETHQKVSERCSSAMTVEREIALLRATGSVAVHPPLPEAAAVLSIIVPVYNSENFLSRCLNTLVNATTLAQLDVVVINDGSRDTSLEIAQQYLQWNRPGQRPVFRILTQANAGHGAAIVAGIHAAVGKYVRVLDSDDWLNTADLDALVELLQTETSDIVLNDYSKVFVSDSQPARQLLYRFMTPGQVYYFDDLCYPAYGFPEWGPILATASYRTQMLQEMNFTLPEKTYYTDMEYNALSIVNAESVVYHPLDVYRYLNGNTTQSISQQAMTRNYSHHERVCLDLIDLLHTYALSAEKHRYIVEKILKPMLDVNYNIILIFCRSRQKFMAFERALQQKAPEFRSFKRSIRFHRLTGGIFVPIAPLLRRCLDRIKIRM